MNYFHAISEGNLQKYTKKKKNALQPLRENKERKGGKKKTAKLQLACPSAAVNSEARNQKLYLLF